MKKEFYHKEWYIWRDEVLRQVRFTPDHGEIVKELYAHYEDSVLDFERIGYEESLARERALSAMGDAAEVGQGLNRAHNFWLGWLFEATKWMMTALCLILAVTVVKDWVFAEGWYRLSSQLKWQTPPAAAAQAETGHGTVYAFPGKVWQEGGMIHQRVDLWLEFDVPQTSRPVTWPLFRYTTDQGEIEVWDSTKRRESGTDPDDGYYDYNSDTDFYAMEGYTRYQCSVRFVTKEPLQWVEVSHGAGDWILRVEMEGRG